MPTTAAIGALLVPSKDNAARTFALWVGGVDMLKQPLAGGNAYGIPIESIEVTENGPGGVSSLHCTIEDPLKVVTIPPAGSEVLFQDIADDHAEFLGFVQTIDVKPHEGQQGRYLELTAIGIECLLDWTIVPSLTLTTLTQSGDAFQAAAAGSGLRDAQQPGAGQGTQATPIAGAVITFLLTNITISGMTLRETIRTIWNQIDPAFGYVPIRSTIDFTRGLRIWAQGLAAPGDYVQLNVYDDVFTNTSAELHYTLTPADVIRGVLVITSGGTQYSFSDGSGIVGQTVVINDSTIVGATLAFQAAQQYMGQFAAQIRGNLHLQTFNHGATKYQAGGNVQIFNAASDLNNDTLFIGSIRKHYNSNGTEEWDVAFGGLAPSVTRSLRRQTRDTLS